MSTVPTGLQSGDVVHLRPILSLDDPKGQQAREGFEREAAFVAFDFGIDAFDEMHARGRFWLWEVQEEQASKGIAILAFYDGSPSLKWLPSNLDLSDQGWVDLTDLVAGLLFGETDEEALWLYLPRPVDEGFHELLIDIGYDPYPEHPGIDRETTMAYVFPREMLEGGDEA